MTTYLDGENDGNFLHSVISPSGKEINIGNDVDIAMKLAMESDSTEIDSTANRRIRLKADLFILPLVCMIYAVQMMDKITNGSAVVMGLEEDLKMKGDMYSWTGSGFYLGYLFFEFPASYIVQRYSLSKCGAIFIFLWGTVLCLCSTPNYAGFQFLRVVLGMLESAITPIFVIITSQWYKKEEQYIRSAIWFSSCGIGVTLGSSIALGCFIHQGSFSIAGWKVLFIITGLLTVVLAVFFYFWIPDSPATAWFLNPEEKIQAAQRIKSNQQGFGNKHFKWSQFKEAWTDYRTYIYFFFGVAICVPNGGLTTFGNIVLVSILGYGVEDSLRFSIYQGLIEFFGCLIIVSTVRYIKHRMVICIFGCSLNLALSCMLAFSTNPHVRLGGFMCLGMSVIGIFTMLSCFSSNVAGHTKKITVNAAFLVAYGAGNIIGPQTFISNQAPQYVGGQIGMVVGYSVSLVLAITLYASYYYDNKRRDKLVAEGKIEAVKDKSNIAFADLTDKENPYFRYSL